MKSLVDFITDARQVFSKEEFEKVLEVFPEDVFDTEINKYGSIVIYLSGETAEKHKFNIPQTKNFSFGAYAGTSDNESAKFVISRPPALHGNIKIQIVKSHSYYKTDYLGKDRKGLATIDDAIKNILDRITGQGPYKRRK